MMNQQPDKFFRDKLENHQTPAPTAAWSRIESGLSKKNNAAFWLKIAASFLVVATAAFMLWPGQKESGLVSTHEKGKPAKVDTVKTEKKSVPFETQSVEAENLVAEKKKTVSPNQKIISPSPRGEKQVPAEERILKSTTTDPVTQQETMVVDDTPVETTPNAVAVVEEKKSDEKNIKITITAAESEKFLNKKTLAQATPVEKKASTLQKLLDKAEDLTNNQDPFGDLRQKKNEILALNFRSEKNQRGQNK